MTPRSTIALVVLLLGPALAGCLGTIGDPDPSSTAAPGPLTPIDRATEGLPTSEPAERVNLEDGETFELTAGYVKHDPGTGEPIRMMAYNGQIPGPEIHAPVGSTFTVEVTNALDQATTVHWHGIRLDNAFDGVPNLTQAPVQPGESFTYEVRVPDAGTFWYHPHVRTDVQKELGLYGALIVEPDKAPTEAYPDEHVLHLDDIRLEDGDVPHMYHEAVTYADSGRWGNHPFVNGSQAASIEALPMERQRLHLVNPANARTWRLSFQGFDTVEKIGTGASYLEAPRAIDELRLGPAERAIVDVVLPLQGSGRIVDQATTWTLARVLPGASTDPMGLLAQQAPDGPHEDARREDRDAFMQQDPDEELHLRMVRNTSRAPGTSAGMHGAGEHEHTGAADPPQGVVDAFPTSRNLTWELVDVPTGEAQPRYSVEVGDVVRLTVDIVHDHGDGGHGAHAPVPHPIHLHGQRLIVESYGDERSEERAWKDTFLANDPERGYQTATVLVEMTTPGTWLVHCHTSEHSEAGMTAILDVAPADG